MIDIPTFKPPRLLHEYEVEGVDYRSHVEKMEDGVLHGWWRWRCKEWPPKFFHAQWCPKTGRCLTHDEPELNLIYFGDEQ